MVTHAYNNICFHTAFPVPWSEEPYALALIPPPAKASGKAMQGKQKPSLLSSFDTDSLRLDIVVDIFSFFIIIINDNINLFALKSIEIPIAIKHSFAM
jgi:hypothetical protein